MASVTRALQIPMHARSPHEHYTSIAMVSGLRQSSWCIFHQLWWYLLFLRCTFSSSLTGTSGLTVTVKNGYVFPHGDYVGMYTSQLQKNVIDALYPQINPKEILQNVHIVNDTVLRYLDLQGTYLADAPLVLPSLFVLRLNGSIVDANNITNSRFNGVSHVGLITLNQTVYSGVIGGIINATVHSNTQMQALSLLNSRRSTVRRLRALSNWESAIGVKGGEQNEISHCDTGGTAANATLGRAIWLLATSSGYVHNCYVHHSLTHALDFDAYTSSSVAWNNLCEDNKAEGIFVEETAHDNIIASNTCRRNKNGIGVYSNVVGPVKGNVFFGNLVEANSNFAMTAGGFGHTPNKHSDTNTFFANLAKSIPSGQAAFNPAHGATQNDYWFNNVVETGDIDYAGVKANAAQVAIFRP